jgi:hypothetical protein
MKGIVLCPRAAVPLLPQSLPTKPGRALARAGPAAASPQVTSCTAGDPGGRARGRAAHPRDVGPGVAAAPVLGDQLDLLVGRPGGLGDVRPQLVVPALAQLLADAARELGHQPRPVALAQLRDQPARGRAPIRDPGPLRDRRARGVRPPAAPQAAAL